MLEVRREGPHVQWFVLNRPERRNALSPELLQELVERCEQTKADEELRVVALRGAGGGFSAGADLMGFMALLQADEPLPLADLGRRAAAALESLPQITVAAIEGACVGGGVVLASACDLRWAAEDSWFSIPELELGVPLAWGGLERLVQLVGETVAAEWVLSCRRFEAQEAHQRGLLSGVLSGDFEQAIAGRVAQMASRPTGALRATKAQLRAIRDRSFDATSDAQALLDALHDPESQRAAQEYIARKVGASG